MHIQYLLYAVYFIRMLHHQADIDEYCLYARDTSFSIASVFIARKGHWPEVFSILMT